MKVGDLVVLSAKGSSLHKNRREVGAIGIIVEVIQYYSYYDYKVRWATKKGLSNRNSLLKRYELKHLRQKKL